MTTTRRRQRLQLDSVAACWSHPSWLPSGEGFCAATHTNENDASDFCVGPDSTGSLNMAHGNGQTPEVDVARERE